MTEMGSERRRPFVHVRIVTLLYELDYDEDVSICIYRLDYDVLG